MKNLRSFTTICLLLLIACCEEPQTEITAVRARVNLSQDVKLNDLQIIGSHNSYKVAIEQRLLNIISTFDADGARALEYEHPPFTEQLELGLRNLELDVFHDPDGGYYRNPRGLNLVRLSFRRPLPYDTENRLREPGLKLFHIQDLDFRSNQLLFKDALAELKSWSDANADHIPIIVTINAKDATAPLTRNPLAFDAPALRNIDTEIRSIFSPEQLITPDLVRGDRATLEQAVLTDGWPEVNSIRGRFLFVLDEGNEKINRYVESFPNLEGAALFVNREEGSPEAAFRILNNPIGDFDKIQSLVAKGYMVRTRSDAETTEARNNDFSRFKSARQSGAQVITTDYYTPSQLFDSDFQVIFEDGTYVREK